MGEMLDYASRPRRKRGRQVKATSAFATLPPENEPRDRFAGELRDLDCTGKPLSAPVVGSSFTLTVRLVGWHRTPERRVEEGLPLESEDLHGHARTGGRAIAELPHAVVAPTP